MPLAMQDAASIKRYAAQLLSLGAKVGGLRSRCGAGSRIRWIGG